MKNLTIIAGLLLSTVTFGNETATSLAKNGELSISFSSNAVCYSVEWSSDLSKEEWHSLYDKQLIPDGLDDISVDVPMFFRVTTTTTIHDVTNGCAYVPVGLISGRDINGNVFSYEITNNLWVSKYEVTAEDFSVFLQEQWDLLKINAKSDSASRIGGAVMIYLNDSAISFVDGIFSVDNERELHPVTGVTDYGMADYCNYMSSKHGLDNAYEVNGNPFMATGNGYRLPTEMEWKYVAKGGNNYMYPWGDTISHDLASYVANTSEFYRVTYGEVGTTEGYNTSFVSSEPYTVPVGSLPNSNGFGIFDLAGNIAERTQTSKCGGGSWADWARYVMPDMIRSGGDRKKIGFRLFRTAE